MIDTFKRYYNFIFWILRNSVLKNKGLAVLIVLTGLMGLVFQLNIFALIIYYARKFASGDNITFLSFVVNPRESWKLLIAFSSAISLLLIFSYFCAYISYRLSLILARKFETACSENIFRLLIRNQIVELPSDQNAASEKYVLRLARGDATWGYRFLISLMSMIVPALTLLFAMGAIFYLEPMLSLVILIFIMFFALVQFNINRKATRFTLAYERSSPLAMIEMNGLLNTLKYQFPELTDHSFINKVLSSGGVKKQQDAFFGRYNIVKQSAFASGIFLSLTLGITLLFMGTSIIFDGHGWERLLVYLIALRYALTNMQSLFSNITGVNRYYPQVSRIYTFIKSFQNQKPSDTELNDEYHVKLPQAFFVGSENAFTLSKGVRVAMITPLKPNRYTLAPLAKLLINDASTLFQAVARSMRFVTNQHSSPDISLRELLQLEVNAGFEELRDFFPDHETYRKAKDELAGNIDKPLTSKKWENIEVDFKLMLSLILAKRSDDDFILIEQKSFGKLNAKVQEFYLNMLKNKITVIIFSSNLLKVGAYGVQIVTVANDHELLGVGNTEWFAAIREQVAKALNIRESETEPTELDEMDDE